MEKSEETQAAKEQGWKQQLGRWQTLSQLASSQGRKDLLKQGALKKLGDVVGSAKMGKIAGSGAIAALSAAQDTSVSNTAFIIAAVLALFKDLNDIMGESIAAAFISFGGIIGSGITAILSIIPVLGTLVGLTGQVAFVGAGFVIGIVSKIASLLLLGMIWWYLGSKFSATYKILMLLDLMPGVDWFPISLFVVLVSWALTEMVAETEKVTSKATEHKESSNGKRSAQGAQPATTAA